MLLIRCKIVSFRPFTGIGHCCRFRFGLAFQCRQPLFQPPKEEANPPEGFLRVPGFDGIVTGMPAVKAGRLRALAVTTSKRWQGTPDIPTMAEAGLAGFEVNSWYGLLAPAGTPREIIARLHAALVKSIGEKETAQRLSSQGMDPVLNTPEQFAERIRNDLPRWGKLIRASGIKAE